jgi:4-hydroxy-tetrahydrodipicolinate reductase
LRVAVAGALGRMGRLTCEAVSRQPDLLLVGGLARSHTGEPLAHVLGLAGDLGLLYDDPLALFAEARPEVVVDFTTYPVSRDVAHSAVVHGVSPVVGASGWTEADRAELARVCDGAGIGACVVPNFALGAVLMMRFAEQAARYFPTAEIVELHHDRKLDAPSGTALLTAERVARAAGREVVPIHSVRLRGLVAHQEVLFGGTGETLTIRHDSLSREAFIDGILLAIRSVRATRGLTVGLEPYLESAPAPAGSTA